MPALHQLRDPDAYVPCAWDLKVDEASRSYWDRLFRWHLDAVIVPRIRADYPSTRAAQIDAFRRDYLKLYDAVNKTPRQFNRIDVLLYTELRRLACDRHGFKDPFFSVKDRENKLALGLLPKLLGEIDAADYEQQRDLLTRGLLAGNIFDLGSTAAIQRYEAGTASFDETRATLKPRPWHIDDVDAFWERWYDPPHVQHVVMFVDNAGSDIVLGCLPLVRWILGRGARVTLAANTEPALNDITASELDVLLKRIVTIDTTLGTALQRGQLRVAATGCRTPLIDLSDLAPRFVTETRDADMIMLHGMGRAIESNFNARFTCDAVWTAMIKDEAVARYHKAGLFDCVFKFARAPEIESTEQST